MTDIGNGAFGGCISLTEITIPDGVTSIGRDAFFNCASLQSITIGKGVSSIGDSAFSGCSSLLSLVIPDTVTSIGKELFIACSSLESLTIPFACGTRDTAAGSSYTYTFGDYFGSSYYEGSVSVSNYYVPATLRSVTVTGGEILDYTFSRFSMLTDITLPKGITTIGEGAFTDARV
jgi:hypothetical protein